MKYKGRNYPGTTGDGQEVVRSPEGVMIPVARRNRRGRKSRRTHSHPLRDIRLSRGLTLEELSELSKLSPSYLSRLESGSRRLNVDTINRLSQALNCQPSALLAEDERWGQQRITTATTPPIPANPYSARAYPAQSQETVGYPAGSIPTQHSAIPETTSAKLPVYGAIHPGGPIDFNHTMGSVSCPPDMIGVPGAFALRVSDDTMAPRYRRGDCVLVHPGKPLATRSTAVVITPTHDVIIGEFIAWRHVNDIAGLQPHPGIVVNPEVEFALELRQYNSAQHHKAVGSDASHASAHQVIVHPTQIASVARIIGTIEG
ncbi:MAG: helix-turn-helix domain-containing protein [Pseudomonadota bacterium]